MTENHLIMKYIDLTHVFDEKISIYPGGKAP
ncbi:MAG: hypothetical protein ACI956_001972, partial [Nonlabens sp.]